MDIYIAFVFTFYLCHTKRSNTDYKRTHKLSIDNNEYGQLSNMVSSNIGVAKISVEPVAKNKC